MEQCFQTFSILRLTYQFLESIVLTIAKIFFQELFYICIHFDIILVINGESCFQDFIPTKMTPPTQCVSFVKKLYHGEHTFVKLEADRKCSVS
jgi:hypothetical protein